jgi:Mg-chelatase subunit ChlI
VLFDAECLAATRLARRAIATALISQVSIVSGGPGVGKTTSVRVLVELLEQRGVP